MKILMLCIINFMVFGQSALAEEYSQMQNATDDQFEVIEISNLNQLRLFLQNPKRVNIIKALTIFKANSNHANSLLLQ